MATKSSITMDYNKAKKQASELEELADELRRLADVQFDDAVAQIQANWTGDNAKAFLKKAKEARKELVASAKKLDDTARSIRDIAKAVYKAEIKALEIANTISGGAGGGGGFR